MDGAFLVNEKGKVMDVSGGVDAEQRNIIVYRKHGKTNQQWDIVYADEYPEDPKKGELNNDFGLYVERDFYIVSQMKSNRYLDLLNNRQMVIKTPNGRNTQTWYFHQQSLTIRTRLNNQSWDIKNAGRTRDMQIWSTNSGWFQIFRYVDEHFLNIQNGKALDVNGGRDEEARPVIVWNRHNGANQRWKVVYKDEAAKPVTKGESKEFGFQINRPFYFVSRLPMGRVVECHGANNIWLRKYRKNVVAQQFWFDNVSKTIRSQQWKNYALTIQSNGGSSNMRMEGVNSRWW